MMISLPVDKAIVSRIKNANSLDSHVTITNNFGLMTTDQFISLILAKKIEKYSLKSRFIRKSCIADKTTFKNDL